MNTLLFFVFSLSTAQAAAPEVFFVSPKDGATVSSPVAVKMGIKGMKLRPAGEDINDKASGHFHILIDKGLVEKGKAIPTDDTDLHFGKAQEETTLKLAPGKHTLTLLLGNGAHRSLGKELSQTIHITVK